jgi:putative flippase GtrA
MGTRKFDKSTPMRSLFGNVITQYVFRLFVGKKIPDTQSGLRCIPMTMIPDLLRLEGEKYEFEMNMLISTKIAHIDIMDEAIQTVYLDNNKSSHFNPLTDSMRIYFLLIRFSFSSIFASTIDFVVFTVLYMLRRDILTSMVLARLVSGSVNFLMNKTLVFHSRIETVLPLVKYIALFIALAVLSYLSIRTIAGFGVNVIVAKALIESLLFFASFSIQRDFIFIGQKEK